MGMGLGLGFGLPGDEMERLSRPPAKAGTAGRAWSGLGLRVRA